MNRFSIVRVSALACALGAALSAQAQELVQDGDFESAFGLPGTSTPYAPGTTFDGFWTVGGTSGVGVDTDDGFNIGGDRSIFLDPLNADLTSGPGAIGQSLGTTAGTRYLISFDVHNDAPSSFTVTFGGTALLRDAQLPILNPSNGVTPPDYVHRSFLATATSGSTLLFFSGSSSSLATIELDNVSVVAQAVPEPATMAAHGLGVLAAFRRRPWAHARSLTS